MGEGQELNLAVEPGETKIVHVGIMMQPYGVDKDALASLALVSYELEFDNGKSYIFQRGFPIFPIK
jgi:hypothetical protein